MNDRSVSLLSNYDIEVLRTWKGRGAILCESKQGLLIWKEYAGSVEKAAFHSEMLKKLQERGIENIEKIVWNKEGEVLTKDQDGTCYVLKTYFDGRECNIRDMDECKQAVRTLAKLHTASFANQILPDTVSFHCTDAEFQKHNRELKKVKKYLKDRSQKTDFEIFLMKSYDYFLNLALQITEEQRFYQKEENPHYLCHGDYQYHNILICGEQMNIVNFEKCQQASPVRDLYLFMRKLLEKSNWAEAIGFELTKAYAEVRPMEKEEYRQLYYRLAYPEKFWKIVNFYNNSGKAWIPGKNTEKLRRLAEQENDRLEFLKKFSTCYGLDSESEHVIL